MKSKAISTLILLVLFVVGSLLMPETGRLAWAQTTSCNSCADCNAKLASGNYSQVTLTTDLLDLGGSCISLVFGESNLVFDCDGHTIDGDDLAIDPDYGIAMLHGENNTIQNCTVSDFSSGIYLWNATNHTVNNNTLTSNGAGIELGFSDSNDINNNVVNENYTGILLYGDGNDGNVINSNVVCNNTITDFNIGGGTGNSGDNNTCDTPDGWNDTGTTGCTIVPDSKE